MMGLPVEFQTQVFLHLDYDDILSLRYCCRHLDSVFQKSSEDILKQAAEHLVEPIRTYYEFLQRLKFPDGSILYPPRGGWPAITKDRMGPYEKSSRAINVLRHLPYIHDDEGHYDFRSDGWKCVGYKSHVINYAAIAERGQFEVKQHADDMIYEKHIVDGDGGGDYDYDVEEGPYLEDLVTIFMGHESNGQTIMLDTLNGVMFEEIVRACEGESMSIGSYCEKRISRLTNLLEVFGPGEEPIESGGGFSLGGPPYDFDQIKAAGEPRRSRNDHSNVRWVAYLYHKFGWPGKDYNKIECQRAVTSFWQKEY